MRHRIKDDVHAEFQHGGVSVPNIARRGKEESNVEAMVRSTLVLVLVLVLEVSLRIEDEDEDELTD